MTWSLIFYLDDSHPKPCASILFKILNIVFFLVGLALVAVGAYVAYKLRDGRILPIGVVLIGAVIIVAAVFGMMGSGFVWTFFLLFLSVL